MVGFYLTQNLLSGFWASSLVMIILSMYFKYRKLKIIHYDISTKCQDVNTLVNSLAYWLYSQDYWELTGYILNKHRKAIFFLKGYLKNLYIWLD